MTRSLTACLLLLAACTNTPTPPPPSTTSAPTSGRADVGGYELAYECHGDRSPTVILEAGLGASGIDEFAGFIDRVATTDRVCTYDRAGVGVSDPRPAGEHVTAGLMADELHHLFGAIEVAPPYVLVGHSYGGMPVRMFGARYPEEVAGIVLVEASSEPEVPIYERLHAGPWIDDTDRIDIHATVRELHAAGDLGDIPLVVVTAGIIADEWLATVPQLAAKAQARLAGLSTDGYQVVAPDSGHFVHRDDPDVVVTAVQAVLDTVGSGGHLPDCGAAFEGTDAICMEPGQIPSLRAA